jgi:hypothetical protein
VRANSLRGDVLRGYGTTRASGPVLLVSLAAAAVLLWPAGAPGADPPPPTAPAFVSLPAIQGDAVVGATLTAMFTATGEPVPTAKYTWRRCRATGGSCDAITGATAKQYVVTAADLGFRLGVKVQIKNKVDSTNATSVTTVVVVAASTPGPGPTPSPGSPPGPAPPVTDPDPTPEPVTPTGGTSFTEPVAPVVTVAARATLLRPFPVVRIRGYFKPGGVRVTLLSVSGPRSAHIAVRCVGRGCPVSAISLVGAPARLRRFERFLPAGTVLQVRVTSAGRVGKYASFRIRAQAAPLRDDLCLMPGRAKPAACPAL